MCSLIFALVFFLNSCLMHCHGFIKETVVATANQISIKQLYRETANQNQQLVTSLNLATEQESLQPVISASTFAVSSSITLSFDDDHVNDICCCPFQEFYVPELAVWMPAYQLTPGTYLLNINQQLVPIVSITCVKRPATMYCLEVSEVHNFFVGTHKILVHNFALPIFFSLTIPFELAAAGGTGGSFLGPIGVAGGVVVGALVGFLIKAVRDHEKFESNFAQIAVADNLNESKPKETSEAQAPGKPTESDGFVPPKKWDGEKVKHPKNNKVGWPDKDGNVWVPTGPKGHGGAHWDVQYPNGKDYANVYPGGKVR